MCKRRIKLVKTFLSMRLNSRLFILGREVGVGKMIKLGRLHLLVILWQCSNTLLVAQKLHFCLIAAVGVCACGLLSRSNLTVKAFVESGVLRKRCLTGCRSLLLGREGLCLEHLRLALLILFGL